MLQTARAVTGSKTFFETTERALLDPDSASQISLLVQPAFRVCERMVLRPTAGSQALH